MSPGCAPRAAHPPRTLRARVAVLVLLLAALIAPPLTGPGPALALEPPPPPALDPTAAFPPPDPPPAADAWAIVDADTGQLLGGEQVDTRRPVASTIKVLTALTVVEREQTPTVVTIGDEVLGVGGASLDLEPGDVWTIDELVTALIVRSGNDVAEALAVQVAGDAERFTALMEDDARALGLTDVRLTSASGLDDAQQLSARDLAIIARAALDDDRLRPMLGLREVDLPGVGRVETRNELLLIDPTATGLKTGFTTAAGPSLVASAQRGERELVVVLLGAEEDPARFTEARRLLDHAQTTTRREVLAAELELVVAGGAVRDVLPDTDVTLPADAEVTLELVLPDRPRPQPGLAQLHLDGELHGELALTRVQDAPAALEPGSAAIGRALADGVYAALRAATADQPLR